jgi:Na+-translocating ferredoxin:NAD+ oxidoreductase RnfD subunit
MRFIYDAINSAATRIGLSLFTPWVYDETMPTEICLPTQAYTTVLECDNFPQQSMDVAYASANYLNALTDNFMQTGNLETAKQAADNHAMAIYGNCTFSQSIEFGPGTEKTIWVPTGEKVTSAFIDPAVVGYAALIPAAYVTLTAAVFAASTTGKTLLNLYNRWKDNKSVVSNDNDNDNTKDTAPKP